MRFGICVPPEMAVKATKIGFDFVELPGAVLALMAEDEFVSLCAEYEENRVKVESLNAIFTPDQRIVGSDADDPEELFAFFDRMIERGARLGIDQFGVGGGAARMVKDGESVIGACGQYIAFVRALCGRAAKYGIRVSIEHLNRGETNFINSVDESLALHGAIARDNCCILIDAYHGEFEKTPEYIKKAGKLISHAHVACPEGRFWPRIGDGADYAPMLRALAENGVPGRVSVEGFAPEGAEPDTAMKETLEAMREAQARM